VILVEGVLVLTDADLRALMSLKIFVDTDPDLRFMRRLERDMNERGRTRESVYEQYLGTVRPMHIEFVQPSRRHADVIIPRGGHNDIAVQMVLSRIHTILHERRDAFQD